MTQNSIFWDKEFCRGQVSSERIKIIEATLGGTLPKSYLNLVKDCDGGVPVKSDFKLHHNGSERIMSTGIGIYLSLNTSEYSDFLETYQSPPEFFPEGIIAFAETGGGDYICFDYRQGKDNPDPPIVYWFHEAATTGKDVSFIANNFEEFLGMLKEEEPLENYLPQK